MSERNGIMESCIFSYCISESDIEIEELTHKYSFGKYNVLTDSRTPFLHADNDRSECAIFGYAVNVFTGSSENLAQDIIDNCSNISDVVAFEKNLGGKYIILYRKGEQYFILGDATCSIPIFYNTDGLFSCSSNPQHIVKQFGYRPDQSLQAIRDSGEISQAMPYDITQYREIKQLIPNHYLDFDSQEAVRFVNSAQSQQAITVEKATELVAPMIETICDFYKSKFKIYCPITSGRDSRVVLAFLAVKNKELQCYTIRHPEHHEDTQDIVVPKQLCKQNNIPYEQIDDVTVSEDLKNGMDHLLGEKNYSLRTLRIAQTIKEHYGDGAVINGDIIGQVGKCSLHRDIPLCFATPGYFRCKLHNYSSESKKQLKLWLEEIKRAGECVNTFDLFSIENRMGRWAAQENLIYNSIGQLYLNVFNSRSIIYLWAAVNRKERKMSSIHVSLIKKKMPKLLEVPFESDDSMIIRLSKANSMTYLLSSYAKFYIQRAKFKRGK